MRTLLFFILLSPSTYLFADDTEKMMESFMKERRKMMESIMQMFNEDDDLFSDSFFDDTSFSDRSKKFKRGQNIKIEEKHEKNGVISLYITPKSKDVNLDIETRNGSIIIKSETKVSEENKEKGNSFKSFSSSSFQRSIQIPRGFEATGPEKSGESIKISLVPKGRIKSMIQKKDKNKNSENEKVPVEKREGEEII